MRDIEKRFFGVSVLRQVSLSLLAHHTLGLIGENGAGKSTLMNILGGVLQPDGGTMSLAGREYGPRGPLEAAQRGIAFIHQELNLFSNLSIAENLFITRFPNWRLLGAPVLKKQVLYSKTRALLEEVGLSCPPHLLVEQLSPGERQLVEVAKAVSHEARIIIFDEPTTSLTARESEHLFELMGRLKRRGVSMIYISHVLSEVFRLCDDLLVLRDGAAVGGGPIREFTVDRLITLMVGRSINQLYPARATAPSSEVLLEVRGVSQPGVVANINFSLRRGEVLGIAGLMGSGRSELARILFGLESHARGEVRLKGQSLNALPPLERIRRGMAFLTENRREEGLCMEAPVLDNAGLVALPSFAAPASRLVRDQPLSAAVAEIGQRVGLRAGPRMLVRNLSGGNQQKVVLAKWLLNRPSLLILDEPTRGIDVGARHDIYTLINELAAQGAGILVISSEIEELLGLCDRILVMAHGEITDGVDRPNFDRERIIRSALSEQQ